MCSYGVFMMTRSAQLLVVWCALFRYAYTSVAVAVVALLMTASSAGAKKNSY